MGTYLADVLLLSNAVSERPCPMTVLPEPGVIILLLIGLLLLFIRRGHHHNGNNIL